MTDTLLPIIGATPPATDLPPSLLLVDDEASILSSLRRLLRPGGYRVYTAGSGAAGLEILARESIDLVISDMRMPEMDGARFLEEVRHRWPQVARILLTGYSDVSSTIAAINRGEIYRYIAKPWDDNELLLTIRDALEHARLKAENVRLLALTQTQNEELRALNAGLERRVRERTAEIEEVNSLLTQANQQLKQNFIVSIKMFSGLIEMRGGAVAGHSRRVADLARRTAEKMGMEGREQQDIFLAGLLHDIGKIGFPDDLLTKPVARMTGDELGRYRKHTLAGEQALMPLDQLKEVALTIRSHHERFDGEGWPDRLQGLGIPLAARILAVVNDYDGLQHGMLFDKRLSEGEAKAMLVHARGKRYDRNVVDAVVDLLGGAPQESRPETLVAPVDLRPGMVLAHDLAGRDGALLLAADYLLDGVIIRQIQEYARREGPIPPLHIRADRK